MRLLTGKDRIAFEAALVESAHGKEASRQYAERMEALQRAYTQALADVSRERQRADNAIDELLAMRGIAPVSVPPEPRDLGDGDLFAEDPVEVAKIEQRMKDEGFGAVLLTEGRG